MRFVQSVCTTIQEQVILIFFLIAIIIIKVSLVLCICIACATEKVTEQEKRGKKSELFAYSHKHDTPLNLVAT